MTTRLIKAVRLGQIDVARMAAIDVLSVGGGQLPFHISPNTTGRSSSNQRPETIALSKENILESGSESSDEVMADKSLRQEETAWIRTRTKIHALGDSKTNSGCGLDLDKPQGILLYEVFDPTERERAACRSALKSGEDTEYCKRKGCFFDRKV